MKKCALNASANRRADPRYDIHIVVVDIASCTSMSDGHSFTGPSHSTRTMPQEAEPITMPMGDGDPLPREIEKLAEAEDGSLLECADVPDEEKSGRNACSPRS